MKPSISSTIKAIALVMISILFSCQPESRQAEFVVLSTSEVAIEGNTENGVVFSASILLSKDEPILEKGFVYAFSSKPTLGKDVKVAAEEEGASKFSSKMMDALAPDTTYFVRSFAKTQSFLTYGNEVTFRSNGSKAPVIEKIEPAIAFWGDTILITGKNFDRSGKNNSVWFGGFEASKRWGTKDTIYAIVPPELNTKKSDVTVKLYGKTSANSKPFEIHSPEVTSISRTEGQHPDTVTVKGNFISKEFGELYFGETKLKKIDASRRSFRFIVPFFGNSQNVDIKLNQLSETIKVKDAFVYNKQAITGISTGSIWWDDTIKVFSENLDFQKIDLSILFEGRSCRQINMSKNSISFIPNYSIKDDHAKKEIILSVQLNNQEVELFNATLSQKAPEIEKIEHSKVGYNRELTLHAKGFYRSEFYTSINIKGENGTSIKLQWGQNVKFDADDVLRFTLPMEVIPGKQDIWIETGGRSSRVFEFDIIPPKISSVSITNPIRTGSITVTGSYLPPSNRSYQIRHISSGRIVPMDYSNDVSSFNPNYFVSRISRLIGRGNYQVEIVFGGQVYAVSDYFYFDDYLVYNGLYNKYETEFEGQVCFAYNDRLYYLMYDEAAMAIIDSKTGKIDKVKTNIMLKDNAGDYWDDFRIFPTIVGQEVYISHNYRLYKFNFESYQWEQFSVNHKNDSIIGTANVNNELVVSTIENDILRYSGTWEKIGQARFNYFTFGVGDYLYTGFNGGVSKYSLVDFKYSGFIGSPLGRRDTYYGFRHLFVHKGNLYESIVGNYDLEIACFSPNNDSFARLDPYYISYRTTSSRFFPDLNGDVYYMYDGFIYKFDPK